MRVLIKEPGKPAEERDIENTLAALQDIVGGYIEEVIYNEHIVIFCNENGKYLGLAPNILNENKITIRDIICGTIVATRVNYDGDCIDMPDDYIDIIFDYLSDWAVEKCLPMKDAAI